MRAVLLASATAAGLSVRSVSRELRLMAAAEEPRYRRFAHVSPWVRNLWRAAADIIEEQRPRKKRDRGSRARGSDDYRLAIVEAGLSLKRGGSVH